MTYKKYNNPKSGFTLLETLVAILILMLAVAGPLTIAQKGLAAAQVAKNQTVAYYLAQDAMEYVRFVRDSNKLAGSPWLAGLDTTPNSHTNAGASGGQCVSAAGDSACYVDSRQDTTTYCGGATCTSRMYYNDSGGWFSNDTNDTPSIFTRTVVIKDISSTEAQVSVTVSWTRPGGGTPPSVTLKENMFDWQ